MDDGSLSVSVMALYKAYGLVIDGSGKLNFGNALDAEILFFILNRKQFPKLVK